MKKTLFLIMFCTCLFIFALSCRNISNSGDRIQKDILMEDLLAWCIVPFDSVQRNPEQRIQMLKELGFKQYAYDWRTKNLDEMGREWRMAKDHGIEVAGIWMWIDPRNDTVGKLSDANTRVFEEIKKQKLSTQIWLSFHPGFFQGLSDEKAVMKGMQMVQFICHKAAKHNCKVGLYNHGDWFGEPQNQIRIIDSVPQYELGLIYNFHHGHHHIDHFEQLTEIMLPYLWVINLNGMKKDGPKILPLGKGEYEKAMIETLLRKGYNGPLGIIGHVEERDVKQVLKENLDGLKKILPVKTRYK